MNEKAIGFYWTLPVPWVGFHSFEDERDAAKAATKSRTIAMQREIIQREVRESHGELIHERVFIEIAPDRGSIAILEPLNTLLEMAKRENAMILCVDFRGAVGFRSHHVLDDFAKANREYFNTVYAYDADAERLRRHFKRWRNLHSEWSEAKHDRAAKALVRSQALRDEGFSFPKAAKVMNEEGIPSLTGRPWNGDNLRKLLTNRDFS